MHCASLVDTQAYFLFFMRETASLIIRLQQCQCSFFPHSSRLLTSEGLRIIVGCLTNIGFAYIHDIYMDVRSKGY